MSNRCFVVVLSVLLVAGCSTNNAARHQTLLEMGEADLEIMWGRCYEGYLKRISYGNDREVSEFIAITKRPPSWDLTPPSSGEKCHWLAQSIEAILVHKEDLTRHEKESYEANLHRWAHKPRTTQEWLDIVLCEVAIKEVPLWQVVFDFNTDLRRICPEGHPPIIRLAESDIADQSVSLSSGRYLSFRSLLNVLSKAYGLEWSLEGNVVILRRINAPAAHSERSSSESMSKPDRVK